MKKVKKDYENLLEDRARSILDKRARSPDFAYGVSKTHPVYKRLYDSYLEEIKCELRLRDINRRDRRGLLSLLFIRH